MNPSLSSSVLLSVSSTVPSQVSLPPSLHPGGSVSLARLATHLSEIRTAAELELQHQRAVGHLVYVFAF